MTSEQEGFSQSLYQQELRLSVEGTPAAEVIARRSISCLGGLGAYGLDYVGESVGGRYVYYTDAANGWPDGGGPYSLWERPAYRYDMEQRTQVEIKLDVASADKQYAAYGEADTFALIEWSTGEIRRVPRVLKPGVHVNTAWSANSQNIAFLESSKLFDPHAKLTLTVWDIERNLTFKIEAPSANNGDAPWAMVWTQPNTIQLTYPDTTTRTIRFTGDALLIESS